MTSPRDPPAVALRTLQAESLAALPWLRHAFSTRAGGVSTVYGHADDLNLGFTPLDDADAVQENRRRLLKATAPTSHAWELITVRQTHSTTVRVVSVPFERPEEADALLTDTSSLLLSILTADCVPILLADTRLRVVAAIHAGWRGTAAGIVEHTVQTMHKQFSSVADDLLAAIGPSVGPCCYQVGEEVRRAFASDQDLFQDDRLDLWLANRRQLLAAGVRSEQIETLAQCTACTRDDKGMRRFFSHRAEHGRTGRMMAVIGIVCDPPSSIG